MEMILVMAIIGLVFAGTYVGMTAINNERSLQKPYVDLRALAKTAWQRAMHEQRAWQIRFHQTSFTLEPRQAVNAEDAQVFHDSDKAKGRGSGVETVQVNEGIVMEVRHWGQKKWLRPEGEGTTWVFEHSGLCEPISVRFTSEGGTIGAQFDPLTASVKEGIFEGDTQ